MTIVAKASPISLLAAALALPALTVAHAQEAPPADILVTGEIPFDPAEATHGPEIEVIISARSGERLQITDTSGASAVVTVSDYTQVKARTGLFEGKPDNISKASLVNGLPVTVETLQWPGGLMASKVSFKAKDLNTALMIHGGTAQQFDEQTAATEALRGRMGDIDQYNIKSTTNVHFDTGRSALSEQAKADLCATASQAEATDNSLMLVVGYTDSRGSQEYNQKLSEQRAGRVINYLQQHCGWKPYRMLTPTGMSEADPAAPNDTAAGMAQNRRVEVNILVSKAVDGFEGSQQLSVR